MNGKGNSFANGACNGGPGSPWRWHNGYQAPPPVTCWDFTEPASTAWCL